MTWNPVTGCRYNCPYCYAKKIAERFGGASETHSNETVGVECQWYTESDGKIHELEEPIYDMDRGCNAPYPFEFDSTFHKYRLTEPLKNKTPQNIFVCSMAELFGDWVPQSWQVEVFNACLKAPQHNYLFLTKNPYMYYCLADNGLMPRRFWYGLTVNKQEDNNKMLTMIFGWGGNKFLSIEPLQEEFSMSQLSNIKFFNWVIIGAETGNRKCKVTPKIEWIDKITTECIENNIPVFMKNSLVSIMGEENMLRQMPKGLTK